MLVEQRAETDRHVEPPITTAPPGTAIDLPLFHTELECTRTTSAGMCNQAPATKSLAINVHRVKDCNVSTQQSELTIAMESNDSPRDYVRVLVPGFPAASGRYDFERENAVALTHGVAGSAGDEVSLGADPSNVQGDEACSKKCVIEVARAGREIDQAAAKLVVARAALGRVDAPRGRVVLDVGEEHHVNGFGDAGIDGGIGRHFTACGE